MVDPERWQKVQGLFEAALEQPPDDIPTWLEEACQGDAELKAEVEDLLPARLPTPGLLSAQEPCPRPRAELVRYRLGAWYA